MLTGIQSNQSKVEQIIYFLEAGLFTAEMNSTILDLNGNTF